MNAAFVYLMQVWR